jgi:hypothetical protein
MSRDGAGFGGRLLGMMPPNLDFRFLIFDLKAGRGRQSKIQN